MDCETFAALPQDFKCSVIGNTIEHKDIIADFSNIFQSSQQELYNQYVVERCFENVLSGRNAAHFIFDGNTELLFKFCEHAIETSSEESSRCKVKAYAVSNNSNVMCLLSRAHPNPAMLGVKPIPFTKLQTVDIKTPHHLRDDVLNKIEDNLPLSYDVVCLSIGLEIIPANRTPAITKLFPEISVILIGTDNVHINKLITDLSNLSDHMTEKSVSTSISANTVGFYLSGNFSCSSTIHFRHGFYKSQLLLARSLRRIKTYPMVNDVYSMGFLKKMTLDSSDAPSVDTNLLTTLRNDLKVMAADNIKLVNENKELHNQLDRLNLEMNTVIGSKDVLSEELRSKLTNEQEIYNKLSEIAVEKVKEQDMSEAKRYELMNKIFSLENDLMGTEIVTAELQKKYDELKDENTRIEALKNDLQTEYITLKNNHKHIVGKHEVLEQRCEQLSVELVQLHMENEELGRARLPLPGIPKGASTVTGSVSPQSENYLSPYRPSMMSSTQSAGKKALLQEISNLKSELEMMKKVGGNYTTMGNISKKDVIQKALVLENSNENLKFQVKELKSSLEIAHRTRECAIEESERLKSSLSAMNLTKNELEHQYNLASEKYKKAVEIFRNRLNSYIFDTEKILQKTHPVPLLKKQLVKMIREIQSSYVEKEHELQEQYDNAKKDCLDITEKYNKLNEEVKNLSDKRAVQMELIKLRKELQAKNEEIACGKLVRLDKIQDILTEQQMGYQEKISLLQNRATVAETQLKRITQFLDRRTLLG